MRWSASELEPPSSDPVEDAARPSPTDSEPTEWSERTPVQPSLLGFFAKFGLGLGGSTVGVLLDGNPQVQGMTAGSGFSALGGIVIVPLRWNRHSVSISVESGYKSWGIGSDVRTHSMRLYRIPVTPLLRYRLALGRGVWSLFIGAGPHWDLSLRYRLRVEGREVTKKLGNELGFAAEGGVVIDFGRLGGDIAFRYTRIIYENNVFLDRADASSFAIFVSLAIGALLDPRPRRSQDRARSSQLADLKKR